MTLPPITPDNPTPDALVTAAPQLPPVAQVLVRLQRLLANYDSSLDDVAKAIRLDAALTTRVIRVGNSVWFSRGGGCQTIEDAVNRMGFREVFRLVAAAAANAFVARPLVAYGRDAATAWHESVSCACAAELLAERVAEETGLSYTIGLLRGIGRTPIDRYAIVAKPGRILADAGFPIDYSESELAMLGFNQATVARIMLTRWDFPETIVEPIAQQYDPLSAPEPHDLQEAILYGARLLHSAVATPDCEIGQLENENEILACIRLTRDDVLACREELATRLKRLSDVLRV